LNLRTFGKKTYCIEEKICDIVGTFRRPPVIRRPHSDSAAGELCPLVPLVTPLLLHFIQDSFGNVDIIWRCVKATGQDHLRTNLHRNSLHCWPKRVELLLCQ